MVDYFEEVKKITNLNISDELLTALVFEMSRFSDKEFTTKIKNIQKTQNIIIDTPTRKNLRKKFYYGNYCSIKTPYQIPYYDYYTDEDIKRAFKDCYERLNTYDSDKIIKSMKKRLDDLKNRVADNNYMKTWLEHYNMRRQNKLYSFVAFKLNQKIFASSNYDENIITDFVSKTYQDLENYRHLAIIIEGEIFNQNKECITWNLLYKAGIYAENFIQFKDQFTPFHKEKQIQNLTDFLNERHIKNAPSLAKNFYTNISTGYKYEDCYISNDQNFKILLYKKIELDTTKIPCPSCNTTIQSGNSYPEMFLKSWECKNPSCPDRSKSGRGKRFDEYGTYRYFKLVENDKDNLIDDKLYQAFRRDIFDHQNNWQEFLIKEYTFAKENIFMKNCEIKETYHRKNVNPEIAKIQSPPNAIPIYSELPIVKLYQNILKNIEFKTGNYLLKNDLEIINDNSSYYLQRLKPGQIGTVITSPPYYNAREYSKWSTMLMYFVDMLINCKAIYNSLAKNSYYLYNIGDIVSEDNVYVVSNMSKRRVQLGFLSSMIFELAGYTLTGNIIWDKGEVQSKRNSTINLVSGYVKCINCYEHILVFRKGKYEKLSNSVKQINPVIKINNKGENLYKHTAPYPIELVELIRPYVNNQLYILDPFLGSGTTLKWCKENHFKGIGTELNKDYFELCKENVRKTK